MTLGYCLNVHPGETLDEVLATLRGPVTRARELSGEPLGVGLYLSAAAAFEVSRSKAALEQLRGALQDADAHVFTANAFPFGGFQEASVKTKVYKPTWWEASRFDFTCAVARVLATLLPDGASASISTLPVCYRALPEKHLDVAGAFLGSIAAHLEKIARTLGRELALAIEPEPLCVIERSTELVRFLEEHVFSKAGLAALEREFPGEDTESIARRRIGACLDTAHHAVVFEPLEQALETYDTAGVRVVKAQLSSALELRPRSPASVERFRAFDEPRYLHQTFFALGETITGAFEDIPLVYHGAALAPYVARSDVGRAHFHVPLAWAGDDALSTTRSLLEQALPAIASATDALEVETYTWSVLPGATRAAFDDDVAKMMAAELAWVRARLRI